MPALQESVLRDFQISSLYRFCPFYRFFLPSLQLSSHLVVSRLPKKVAAVAVTLTNIQNRDYFVALLAVYGFSLLVSWGRSYIVNGFSHRAFFENQTDQTVRMSIPTRINWRPGQHIFVRFPTINTGAPHSLTSHPFSICSLPESTTRSAGRELVFYIRPHSGVTRQMYEFADTNKGSTVPVHLDGPYGGVDPATFDGFGRVLVIAGGSGAGAMFPLIENVVRRAPKTARATDAAAESAPTLDVQFFWAMRHIGLYFLSITKASCGSVTDRSGRFTDSLEWFKEPMNHILSIPSRANVRVSVHVTRETGSSNTSNASIPEKSSKSDAQPATQPGEVDVSKDGARPDLSTVIDAAASDASGPVAIAGPYLYTPLPLYIQMCVG